MKRVAFTQSGFELASDHPYTYTPSGLPIQFQCKHFIFHSSLRILSARCVFQRSEAADYARGVREAEHLRVSTAMGSRL